MSEGAAVRQMLKPDQSPLLGTCRGRGCKRGQVEVVPGAWETCGRCHRSGYDTEVPRVRTSATSTAAANSVREVAASIRARLLDLLAQNPNGLSDEEMQDRLNLSGNAQRPRRRELEKLGLIKPLGTRPVRSGRDAQVWALVRTPPDAAA
jgi:hypothetical protein